MKNTAILCAMLLLISNMAIAQTTVKTPSESMSVQIVKTQLNGTTLTVDMLWENLGSDATLALDERNWTSMIDDEENEYNGKKCEIIQKFMGDRRAYHFPANIPLRFRLQIKGVSETLSKVNLLKIGLKANSPTPFSGYVEIKDIEIEK